MRRRSRECALQMLYQMDANQQLTVAGAELREEWLEPAIASFWSNFDGADAPPVDREFAERLVRGVVRELVAIDAAIDGASEHWKLGRMNKVDRNLIRVAVYEIESCPDIPVGASINEALEIARRFSGQESVPFVNGVLDKIANQGDRELEC